MPTVWPIGYVKRKFQERKAKYKDETPQDRATRRTTNATVWMAFFTFVLVLVGIGTYFILKNQLKEMHEGGTDTHDLATAAILSSRAWVSPSQILLESPLESGLPVKYQIHMFNSGKEPAIGVLWNVEATGAAYIRMESGSMRIGDNMTCANLNPVPSSGVVLYPAGDIRFWVPLDIPDTPDNRRLISAVLNRTNSLIVTGCFAYISSGKRRTSAFRFFLRDVPGTPSLIPDRPNKPGSAWHFNFALDGNDAN